MTQLGSSDLETLEDVHPEASPNGVGLGIGGNHELAANPFEGETADTEPPPSPEKPNGMREDFAPEFEVNTTVIRQFISSPTEELRQLFWPHEVGETTGLSPFGLTAADGRGAVSNR